MSLPRQEVRYDHGNSDIFTASNVSFSNRHSYSCAYAHSYAIEALSQQRRERLVASRVRMRTRAVCYWSTAMPTAWQRKQAGGTPASRADALAHARAQGRVYQRHAINLGVVIMVNLSGLIQLGHRLRLVDTLAQRCAFFTRMHIAFVAGVFVSSPVIFYQIWSFIAPGL